MLIVGVGGLGSPIALYLAGAGVGTLGLVDDDQVSISNLQRQVLYAEADLGQPKPLCGARRVQGLNSDVNVEVYPFRLDKKNAGELIRNYDIVVDGCDNFATRYLLNDVCNAWGKPYVYGAIQGFEGQVSVFCYGEGAKNYRDLYPDEEDKKNAGELIRNYDIVVDGCDNFATRYLLNDVCNAWGKPYVYGAIQGFEGQVSVFCYGEGAKNYRDLYPDEEGTLLMPSPDKSVIGVTPAIVGSVEANEVLKLICGYGEPLAGKLWTIDLRTMQSYILSL